MEQSHGRPFPRVASICMVLVCLFTSIPSSAAQGIAIADDKAGLKDPPELKPMKYRLVGPAWGGRVSRAAGIAGDPNTYYAASASGGVWKSTDGGLTWKPIFDEQPISSIGSIAVAPSDPNVIYVGSGEANIRGNVAPGNGIYKSLDAGKSWTHVWKQEGQIGTMCVHPSNPNVAFAAVLGHAFGPNPERGVYRTKDGGKTWEQVLKKDENTGASDVALDPSNPNILFAGLWQARRRSWELESGGPGSGLYMSRDGGDTWKQLTEKGLPKGPWGKIGVAVAPSDGRRVYALIEAEEGGMFRSDDGGDTWTRTSGNRLLRQRAWYYSTITVNPTNPLVGTSVTFDASATTDPDNNIVSYRWDFGDGTPAATVSTRQVSHAFASYGTYRVTLVVTDGFGRTDEYSFDVLVQGVGGDGSALVLGVIIAAALATILFAASEPGRVALMTATTGRMYARKPKDEKDSEIRGAILYYVRVHPGDCYMDIKRNLDLNDGVVTYHLARLEKDALIRSAIQGARMRYYPAEMRVPLENGGELHEIQQRILRVIAQAPGMPVAVLSEQLGLSTQLTLYHLRKLAQGGRVQLERSGLRLRAFPPRTHP